MGAVTTERTPIAGCRVHPLGVMRYVPVASKAYMKRYLPEASRHMPWPKPRRWRGIATTPYRMTWCAKHFDAISPDRCIAYRRRRVSAPQCSLGWVGACSRSSWQRHTWPIARFYGSQMYISTCRCTDSAGNWTAR
jgi:hypothetical protein